MDSDSITFFSKHLRTLKRVAWTAIAIGSCASMWALWLGLHRKENPANVGNMQMYLAIGVGLYMVGRLILISIRMSERKRTAPQ